MRARASAHCEPLMPWPPLQVDASVGTAPTCGCGHPGLGLVSMEPETTQLVSLDLSLGSQVLPPTPCAARPSFRFFYGCF